MKLTPKQEYVLCETERAMKHFDAIGTSRNVPLRVMLQLEKLKLVKDIGLVYECDDDGFVKQPERCSTGWALTAAGKRMVKSFG